MRAVDAVSVAIGRSLPRVGSENGNGRRGSGHAGSVELTVQVASARSLARAIVVSFDACDDQDVPLSELQRIAIIEAALLEFDGFGVHLSSLTSLGSLFRELGSV